MNMYRMIGADGKEYGPLTEAQLLEFITQRRANNFTRVRREGTEDWRALGEWPEFAEALRNAQAAAPALPPSAAEPPRTGDSLADQMAREILARDYQVNIGSCVSRGWELVKKHFWLSVGVTFLIMAVSAAVGAVPVLGIVAGLALNYVFWGGLDWFFLKLARGEKAEVSDAFVGFSKAFVPLMLFSLVGQLLTTIGFALCILPGIYLMVAWLLFTALLIIDKKLDFWPAMELSRKVISHHWFSVFGLFLVTLLIMLAGLLALVIGFFVALPVCVAAIVYAYEDIFNGAPQAPVAVTQVPAA
jgi:hypothetical protein